MQCAIIKIQTCAHGILHHHSRRLLHCAGTISPRRWAEAKKRQHLPLLQPVPYILLRLNIHVSHQTFLQLESGKEHLLQHTPPLSFVLRLPR